MTNVFLLSGGNGSEHEISLISAKYLKEQLNKNKDFCVYDVLLNEGKFIYENSIGYFTDGQKFIVNNKAIEVHCVVPCFHGTPGETGQIQGFLDILNIPYIGCGKDASHICFNKIITKDFLNILNIPNTPFISLLDKNNLDIDFIYKSFESFNSDVYIKAATEGSSVGCYHVRKKDELIDFIKKAFSYSQNVLMEKTIEHRELEIAAFEIDGRIYTSTPGEIVIPKDTFYTFDEKYSKDSKSTTTCNPENLDQSIIVKMQEYAKRAYVGCNIKDLCRIDFFLTKDGQIILNEINTFPGMTPISMFPKLLEHSGFSMSEFLTQAVLRAIK